VKLTGVVYQLITTKEDEFAWEPMDASGMPPPATSGVHYEIFTSGSSIKCTLLMNLDTGKTWQLETKGKPVWKPIK